MYHKGSHPLLMLFMEPFGFVVSVFPKLRGPVYAVIINSAFGALAVVLSFICYWIFNRSLVQCIIVAALYGCTTGQVFFGAIPESRTIEASVIITSYVLLAASLNGVKVRFPFWVAAGLMTFGVTVTHFFHTLSAFIGKCLYLHENKPLKLIVKIGVTVLLSAFILSLVQKGLIPESKLFFLRQTVDHEIRFSVFDRERGIIPYKVIRDLRKHFGVYNIISPQPDITRKPSQLPAGMNIEIAKDKITKVKLINSNFTALGKIGVVLWLLIAVFGVIRNSFTFMRDRKRRTTLLVTAATIAFTMVLHSLYGNYEMFLYYVSFTFPVLLFVIDPNFKSKLYSGLLVLLLGVVGINNFLIVWRIAASVN